MSQIILIGDIQALCTGRFVPATRRSTRAHYSAGLFQVTASGGIGLPGDCLLSIGCRTGRRHDWQSDRPAADFRETAPTN